MGQGRNHTKKFTIFWTNKNTTYQNVWDVPKAVLGEKFIALNACIRKEERSKINHLSLYLSKLEKKSKLNPKSVEEKK